MRIWIRSLSFLIFILVLTSCGRKQEPPKLPEYTGPRGRTEEQIIQGLDKAQVLDFSLKSKNKNKK